jgi:hypothetical protein
MQHRVGNDTQLYMGGHGSVVDVVWLAEAQRVRCSCDRKSLELTIGATLT